MIACVSASLLDTLGWFEGVVTDERYHAITNKANWSYRIRDQVEHDASWKQLIPYILLRLKNVEALGPDKFLTYQRGREGGEQRLHSKLSLGVGGHVEVSDDNGEPGPQVLLATAMRELREELNFDGVAQLHAAGYLYHAGDAVSRVHLGVVYVLDTQQKVISSRIPELRSLSWMTLHGLQEQRDRLEAWSQHCLDWLQRSKPA